MTIKRIKCKKRSVKFNTCVIELNAPTTKTIKIQKRRKKNVESIEIFDDLLGVKYESIDLSKFRNCTSIYIFYIKIVFWRFQYAN